ncbi:MAG: ABC transporter ATP-binding protein [Myxococcota bacterium]
MVDAMIDIDDLVVRFPAPSAATPPRAAVDGLSPERAGRRLLRPARAQRRRQVDDALAALAGLIRPTSGRVRVAGLDPTRRRVQALIGLVPQALALHAALTVRENLAIQGGLMGLAGARLRERIAWAVAVARLEGRERSRVATLSGGMQRRLNLVASLLHDPRLVICDEPAGVDPQSRNHLFDMLRALHAEGRTILYTTHYMEEVETLCSHVAIVDHGKLVTKGALADLLAGDRGAREHPGGPRAGCRGGARRRRSRRCRGRRGRHPHRAGGGGLHVASVRPKHKEPRGRVPQLTGRALKDDA